VGTYYDFNATRWAQALQVGIYFLLDRKEKWNLYPHFAFALNETTLPATWSLRALPALTSAITSDALA
jgi:hypothetical protein